jgi:CheY-like chemotaxis protein
MMDITMPGMSGWDVAYRLRADGMDDLAIMMVSAEAREFSLRDTAETGGSNWPHDDYLIKPFELHEMFDRIQTLLDIEWVYDPVAVTPAAAPVFTHIALDAIGKDAVSEDAE